MKKFAVFLLMILISFIILISFCKAQDRQITATGEAEIQGSNTMGARQQALTVAYRRAVEKGIGTYIKSQTIVENMQLISDNIYSNAQGYIKDQEIIEEGQRPDSKTYFVTIKATVNVAEIGTDLRSLGILQDIMGNPKILSFIQEISTTGGSTTLVNGSSASIAIEEALQNYNFDLVDREQVDKIRLEEMERMGEFFMESLMEDHKAISRIAQKALENGAQYLLMGTATIDAAANVGATFQSHATIKCRVVDASTAEKVALTQKSESGAGVDRKSADMNAGRRIGEEAANTIIPQIIQNWSKRANRGVAFIIKLYGVKSYGGECRKFMKAVEKISGVTSCNKRLWDAKLQRLELDLTYKGGTCESLIDAIFNAAGGIPGFENFDLEEQTGNNINFVIKSISR